MAVILAKDIMTKKVWSVRPETKVLNLARFLLKHKISGVPVVDKAGKLKGIVTESDLIFRDARIHLPTVITLFDSFIYLENPNKVQKELKKIVGSRVQDIMSTEVTSITPETDLVAMATLMHEQQRHLLPVLKAGRLVGVVGKADLVRAIAREESA